MDLSDARRASAQAVVTEESSDLGSATPDPAEVGRWRDLVDSVGREIGGTLTTALERVHALTTTGRIDKASLRALREEITSARNAGMIAQQLSRLSVERLRISYERMSLTDMLADVIAHRRRETEARGLRVQPTLKPADVLVDASLLFNLLNSLLDWTLVHARGEIEFAIDLKSWPTTARLTCRFEHREAHEHRLGIDGSNVVEELDTLVWRLIEATAKIMGLALSRALEGGFVNVVVGFPRTVSDQPEAISTRDVNDGFALSTNSRPLAGSHVLVIASRRDVRMRVRNAIHHMGLILDLVTSVDEATDFCREGLPHAIIIESILRGEKLNQLRREILAEVQDFAFIEIIEEGSAFEMSGFGTASMGRVGRDAIESALPSVLMFELSKTN